MVKRFGELIEAYRRRAQWRQQDLAEAAQVHRSAISRTENPPEDSPDYPPLAVARTIMGALHRQHPFQWGELQELATAYLIPPALRDEQGQSKVIGVSVPSGARSAIWSCMVGAIEEEARQRGYMIVLCQHDEEIDQQLEHLDFFADLPGLAGLILAPAVGITEPPRWQRYGLYDALEPLRKRQVPIVFIDRKVPARVPVPYVGLDNVAAAKRAVEHLIKAGHRRIGALLALPHASTQQERHDGYRRALDRIGAYDETLVRWGEEVPRANREKDRARYGIRRGLRNATELLSLPEGQRPTAIFCATYYMALEALKAMQTLDPSGTRLSVPKQLALIGFDDVPELDIPTPQISRLEYPVSDLAKRAVAKIETLIANPQDSRALQDALIKTFYIAEKGSVGGA